MKQNNFLVRSFDFIEIEINQFMLGTFILFFLFPLLHPESGPLKLSSLNETKLLLY